MVELQARHLRASAIPERIICCIAAISAQIVGLCPSGARTRQAILDENVSDAILTIIIRIDKLCLRVNLDGFLAYVSPSGFGVNLTYRNVGGLLFASFGSRQK